MAAFPDWFSVRIPQFSKHLESLRAREGVQALQIGAYTGDASTWLLDQTLTGAKAQLTDVDTWMGSAEEWQHDALNWTSVWAVYRDRMRGRNVLPYRMTSDEFFDFIGPGARYDFIYVDGDHHSEQVWRDALNADAHLRVGGILAFDDYTWRGHGDPPAVAIDKFLAEHGHRYTLLEKAVQVWLQKVTYR